MQSQLKQATDKGQSTTMPIPSMLVLIFHPDRLGPYYMLFVYLCQYIVWFVRTAASEVV